MLPVLQSIALQLVERVQFVKIFGGVQVHKLLQEMLLGDTEQLPIESLSPPQPAPTTPEESLLNMINDINFWAVQEPGALLNTHQDHVPVNGQSSDYPNELMNSLRPDGV